MLKVIRFFDDCLEKISRWGIVSSLVLILLLAVCAILLRWLEKSNMWIEPLVRHLVFLSAFFGGSLATSKNVHIKVDVLTKLIEQSNSKALHWFHRNAVTAFCFVTCLFLMRAGWDFYNVEKEFGAPAFLEIHSSILVGIIPAGMGLIALRFLNQLIISLFNGDKIEYPSVQ